MKKSLGARTLLYPAPVLVIGTYNPDGRPNVMTASWGGICCSQPPCVAVSLRRATHTFGNLFHRKAFTVNVPSETFVRHADYFGIVSGKEIDKFAGARLTAVRSDRVDAPYVQEFPLVLECSVLHTLEIGIHTQFIGEILDVKAEESVLNDQGMPDITKVKPLVFTPDSQSYYGLGNYLGQAFSLGENL